MSVLIGAALSRRLELMEHELKYELNFLVSAFSCWERSREIAKRGQLRLSLDRAERCVAALQDLLNDTAIVQANGAKDHSVSDVSSLLLTEASELVGRAKHMLNRTPRVKKTEGNVVHLELESLDSAAELNDDVFAALRLNQMLASDNGLTETVRHGGLRLAYSAKHAGKD